MYLGSKSPYSHLHFRTQILLCDILPRSQSYFEDQQVEVSLLDAINTEASTVNYTVHLVSEFLPWIDYVQFPSFLQDHVIKRHMLSRDGLHLSFRATKYVADTITSSILKYLDHKEQDSSCNITTEPDTCYDSTKESDPGYDNSSKPNTSYDSTREPDPSHKSTITTEPDSSYECSTEPDSSKVDPTEPDSSYDCSDPNYDSST